MGSATPTCRLTAVLLPDPAQAWTEMGFTLNEGSVQLGSVMITPRDDGANTCIGIADPDPPNSTLDGLKVCHITPASGAVPEHPNGARSIDHLVVTTSDLSRFERAAELLGLDLRRRRDTNIFGQPSLQCFYWLGDTLLEVVGPATPVPGPPDATLWGITFVVNNLEATVGSLGPRAGTIRDAVQGGRRIATLRAHGLWPSVRLAAMTPHERSHDPADHGPLGQGSSQSER
ncbi:MAG TPA: hypothetical protein DEG43_00635 [Acidimicrobiaceae bacterium]|nr:hypothetical protein [Acidimicrobiaceae bacterium]